MCDLIIADYNIYFYMQYVTRRSLNFFRCGFPDTLINRDLLSLSVDDLKCDSGFCWQLLVLRILRKKFKRITWYSDNGANANSIVADWPVVRRNDTRNRFVHCCLVRPSKERKVLVSWSEWTFVAEILIFVYIFILFNYFVSQ